MSTKEQALRNWEWNFVSVCCFPDSTCVSECPAGTYSTRQEADGKELGFCLPCDHVCSSCTGASPRDCLTCSPGYLHLLQLCVTHCPTGYNAESSVTGSERYLLCDEAQPLLIVCWLYPHPLMLIQKNTERIMWTCEPYLLHHNVFRRRAASSKKILLISWCYVTKFCH